MFENGLGGLGVAVLCTWVRSPFHGKVDIKNAEREERCFSSEERGGGERRLSFGQVGFRDKSYQGSVPLCIFLRNCVTLLIQEGNETIRNQFSFKGVS